MKVGIVMFGVLVALQGCANRDVKPSSPAGVAVPSVPGRAAPSAPSARGYIDDPRLDPIRDKVALTLRGDAVTPAQLNNGRRPGAMEKEAIKTWQTLRLADHQRARQERGPPSQRLQTTRILLTRAITQLYAGRLTYGQFARQVVEIDAQHRGVALRSVE